MPRPPIGPGDRTIHLVDAARRLGVTRSTLQTRVRAQNPSIRGVAPHTDLNPGRSWLVSLDDVEAELRGKGLLDPGPPETEPSVDAMRAQMLQAALSDEKDRRIAELEAEVTRLRSQLTALGRAFEEQMAANSRTVEAAGRSVAALTGA